ncbi:hypothetical protein QM012_004329 [Aureobasidium pullulans]|uniref:Uncharacterized protein n=1 Tax=Aureobasidium pullulans TaxID=5580 RepID=A0ABR0TST0_AURPU
MSRISIVSAFFALLSCCLITLVHSHTHLVWIVGLREGQTFEKHLGLVGRSIPVKEHKSEINGYTASVSDDDTDLLRAIRSDPNVGFAVRMPEDYFRKTEKFIEDGWDEDDDDLYEHMTRPDHYWRDLQSKDPEVQVSDEGGHKMYLEWHVNLEDGYEIDEHIHRIMGRDPLPFWLDRSSYVNSYTVRFANEEQEKRLCPLIQEDPLVRSIGPVRGYSMNDEIHDEL